MGFNPFSGLKKIKREKEHILAELTRKFNEQKVEIHRKINDAQLEAKARLTKELECLALIEAAIKACVSGNDLQAIDKVVEYIITGQDMASIQAFLNFNPAGISLIFGHQHVADQILDKFASHIDPQAPSFIDLTLAESLIFSNSIEFHLKVAKTVKPALDRNNKNWAFAELEKNAIYKLFNKDYEEQLNYTRVRQIERDGLFAYMMSNWRGHLSTLFISYANVCNLLIYTTDPNSDGNKIPLLNVVKYGMSSILMQAVNRGYYSDEAFELSKEISKNNTAYACHFDVFQIISYAKFMHEQKSKFNTFDINVGRNTEGHTPLTCAIHEQNLSVIQFILERSSSVNTPTTSGYTPLQIAIMTGNLAIVKQLIRNGAKVTQDGKIISVNGVTRKSCLDIANEFGQAEIVEYLKLTIKVQANFGYVRSTVPEDFSHAALYWAISNSAISTLEWLYETGIELNVETRDFSLPLGTAIKQENPEMALWLLRHGANAYDIVQTVATQQVNIAIERGIVANGSAIVGTNGELYMPAQECLDIINCWRTLNPTNINSLITTEDPYTGQSALTKAVCDNDLTMVMALICSGVDINQQNNLRETPLYLAVSHQHLDIVRLLLTMGVNVSIAHAGNETFRRMIVVYLAKHYLWQLQFPLMLHGTIFRKKLAADKNIFDILLNTPNQLLVDNALQAKKVEHSTIASSLNIQVELWEQQHSDQHCLPVANNIAKYSVNIFTPLEASVKVNRELPNTLHLKGYLGKCKWVIYNGQNIVVQRKKDGSVLHRPFYPGINYALAFEQLDHAQDLRKNFAVKTLLIAAVLHRLNVMHASMLTMENLDLSDFVWDLEESTCRFVGFNKLLPMTDSNKLDAIARLSSAILEHAGHLPMAVNLQLQNVNIDANQLVAACHKMYDNLELYIGMDYPRAWYKPKCDMITASREAVTHPPYQTTKKAALQERYIRLYLSHHDQEIPAHVPFATKHLIQVLRQENIRDLDKFLHDLNKVQYVEDGNCYRVVGEHAGTVDLIAVALDALKSQAPKNSMLLLYTPDMLVKELKQHAHDNAELFRYEGEVHESLVWLSALVHKFMVNLDLHTSTGIIPIYPVVTYQSKIHILHDDGFQAIILVNSAALDEDTRRIIFKHYQGKSRIVPNSYGFEHIAPHNISECYMLPRSAIAIENAALQGKKFVLFHRVEGLLRITKVQTASINNRLTYLIEHDTRTNLSDAYMASATISLAKRFGIRQINFDRADPKYLPNTKDAIKESGFNPNNIMVNYRPMVLEAIYVARNTDNRDILTICENLGSSVNAIDEKGVPAIIIAAVAGKWDIVKRLAKRDSASLLAVNPKTGRSLLEITQEIGNILIAEQIAQAQFVHYQGMSANPTIAFTVVDNLKNNYWITPELHAKYELRSQYYELKLREKELGGLPLDPVDLTAIAMQLKVKIIIDTEDIAPAFYGEQNHPEVRITPILENGARVINKNQLITQCLAASELNATITVDAVLESMARIAVGVIDNDYPETNRTLRAKIEPNLIIVKQNLLRAELNANLDQQLREVIIEIQKQVEDNYIIIKEQLEKSRLELIAAITAQYNNNYGEISESYDRAYKKAKRKVTIGIGAGLAAIGVTWWYAPKIAAFATANFGTMTSAGVATSTSTSLMVEGALKAALSYALTSVPMGNIDVKSFAKNIAIGAIGAGVGNHAISKFKILNNYQEITMAASYSAVASMVNDDIKHILGNMVLAGIVRTGSEKLASIVVPLPDKMDSLFSVRDACHSFLTGFNAAVMHTYGEKALYNRKVDLSQSLVQGLNATLGDSLAKYSNQKKIDKPKPMSEVLEAGPITPIHKPDSDGLTRRAALVGLVGLRRRRENEYEDNDEPYSGGLSSGDEASAMQSKSSERRVIILAGPGGTAFNNETVVQMQNAFERHGATTQVIGDGQSNITVKDIKLAIKLKDNDYTPITVVILMHGDQRNDEHRVLMREEKGGTISSCEIFKFFTDKLGQRVEFFSAACHGGGALSCGSSMPGNSIVVLSPATELVVGPDIDRWISALDETNRKIDLSARGLLNIYLANALQNRTAPLIADVDGVNSLPTAFCSLLESPITKDETKIIYNRLSNVLGREKISNLLDKISEAGEFGITAKDYGAALLMSSVLKRGRIAYDNYRPDEIHSDCYPKRDIFEELARHYPSQFSERSFGMLPSQDSEHYKTSSSTLSNKPREHFKLKSQLPETHANSGMRHVFALGRGIESGRDNVTDMVLNLDETARDIAILSWDIVNAIGYLSIGFATAGSMRRNRSRQDAIINIVDDFKAADSVKRTEMLAEFSTSLIFSRALGNLARAAVTKAMEAKGLAIPTRHGWAYQEFSKSAIALCTQTKAGGWVCRMVSEKNDIYVKPHGRNPQFWAVITESPKSITTDPTYAMRNAMPVKNAIIANGIQIGKVIPGKPFIIRKIKPLGPNPGGGYEIVCKPGAILFSQVPASLPRQIVGNRTKLQQIISSSTIALTNEANLFPMMVLDSELNKKQEEIKDSKIAKPNIG